MNQTLIIGKKDAEELLTMEACIRAMEETFRDISAGKTTMLQRSMMPQKKGNTFALMASDNQQQEICGVKAIVFPGSEAKKNGTSQGIIPLFDSATGALLAIVDAEHITALRTAAASAAATRVLAREESCTHWPDAHCRHIPGAPHPPCLCMEPHSCRWRSLLQMGKRAVGTGSCPVRNTP